MSNTAELVFDIDYKSALSATKSLTSLENQFKRTASQMNTSTKAFTKANLATGQLSSAIVKASKLANTSTKQLRDSTSAMHAMSKGIEHVIRSSSKLDGVTSAIGRLSKASKGTGSLAVTKLETSSGGSASPKLADGLAQSIGASTNPLELAVSGAQKIAEVTAEYQQLEARLTSFTGSAEKGADTFDTLNAFAAKTPYSVQQVSNAFMDLANNGLTPTQDAMTAYGDMASAMGMTIEEVSSSVIDATSSQSKTQLDAFANLGVGAQQSGEFLKLTYNGVTSTIRNNSQDIEGYLTSLGKNNFAGAMSAQLDTLGGATARFSGQWDNLFANLGEQGLGTLMADGVNLASNALEGLNSILASGKLTGTLKAAFGGIFDDVSTSLAIISPMFEATLNTLSGILTRVFKDWQSDTGNTMDGIGNALMSLPTHAQFAIKMLVTHLAGLPSKGAIYASALADNIKNKLSYLVDVSKIAGQSITNIFDSDFNFDAEIQKASDAAQNRKNAIEDEKNAKLDAIRAIEDASLKSLETQKKARLDALKNELDAIDKSSEKFEEIAAKRTESFQNSNTREDLGLTPPKAPDSTVSEQFEQLKAQLLTEEETLKDSYERRKAIILEGTQNNHDERTELEAKLKEQVAEELLEDSESNRPSIDDEIQFVEEKFNEKIALAKAMRQEEFDQDLEDSNEHLSQKSELEVQLEQQKTEQLKALKLRKQQEELNDTADFLGNLSSIASAFGGKQSKAARTAAIAEATVRTYGAAQKAFYAHAHNLPLAIAASAAAITAGMANVRAIKSVNVSGNYDYGGMIPAGKLGLVGEFGPELISGPANITSRRTTAQLTDATKAQEPSQNIDKSVKFNYTINANDAEGVTAILKKERARIMRDVRYAMESGEWD